MCYRHRVWNPFINYVSNEIRIVSTPMDTGDPASVISSDV